MLRGVDVGEAVGPRCEIGAGLLGNVGRVVVQDDADGAVLGVIIMKVFEEGDEFLASVTGFDTGDDVSILKIQSGED